MATSNRKPNTIVRRAMKRPATTLKSAISPSKPSKLLTAPTPPKKTLTALEAAETLKRQASDLSLRDNEIRLLKVRLIKQEEKFTQLKGVIVNIASTASRNNSVTPGILHDWANKMLQIINRRQ